MSLLKEINDKGAVLAWSPKIESPNFIAIGTKDSAGTGFDDHGGELELHHLDFSTADDINTNVVGKVRASSRFSSIAWSQMANHSNEFQHGLIAGGMVDGIVNVWNPSKLLTGEDDLLLASVEQHQGSVSALHFNPHRESSHLLATGGSDAEIYVISLDRPDMPSVFVPAPPPNNAKHSADITQVAWNTQVAHILASSSQNGSCFVWDLRQKRAWCELRDPAGGCVSDIAWNPDQGLHIITASGDDKNPVLKLWDLRSSTSLPLATLQGHTEGILSISWCLADTSLLLSCGKDNRTLIWDLFTLQPVYELPSRRQAVSDFGDQGVFGNLATSASHRRYNVSWSPTLPAVISTSSFDRKVQFYSTTGFRSKTGRAPKWLRRPVGATFGFGGKLVVINNQAQTTNNGKKSGGAKLHVHQVAENPELVSTSDEFHDALSKGQFRELCEAKSKGIDERNNQIWKLMKVICFGTNAREELLTYLGFDSASISASAESYIATPNSDPSNALSSLTLEGTNASDVFSSTSLASAGSSSGGGGGRFDHDKLSEVQKSKLFSLLDIVQSGVLAEPTIRRSLIVGNFEMAVECCLRAGLLAEALLLAQCGGQELRVKTQAAFFERQRHEHPFLNVLHAVIKNQLMEFVNNSDLKNWKETLALLSTYGKSEEFSGLCESLASRLENEVDDRASAALCYMCAANVPRTIKYWTEVLNDANKALGQLDTSALQDYVEKIMVFTQANPVNDLGAECGEYFARYADILASQGRLGSAFNYLKGDSIPIKVLVDRIYHAGSKPAGSRPPAFPFDKINVEPFNPQQVAQVQPQPINGQLQVQQAASSSSKAASQKPDPRAVRSDHNPAALAAAQAVSQPNPSATQNSALPPGWVQLIDPSSNRPYYANQTTGQSQWEPPTLPSVPVKPVEAVIPPQPQVHQATNTPLKQDLPIASNPIPNPQIPTTPIVEAASANPRESDAVIALGQMIEAIAVSNLTPPEKKQVSMLRSSYTILHEKLQAGELSADILQKISNLTDALVYKNFSAANLIQTELVNTAWNQHKEWIKGMKILIQLASKK